MRTEVEPAQGQRVAGLAKGLDAPPREALYLIYRRARQVPVDPGLTIHRRYVGEHVTSLEMAGTALPIPRRPPACRPRR